LGCGRNEINRFLQRIIKGEKVTVNIWMFNHYAITPDYPGGTRHFQLAKNLVLSGHKVVIFAANFIHYNFISVPVDEVRGYKFENREGVEFVWLKTRSYRGNNWRRFANMLDYCRAAKKNARKLVKERKLEAPDIIIGSTVHPFTPLMAAKLAQRFNIPFVFEIRDLWPQTFIDMGTWKASSLQARVFKWIEKRSVKKANKIIALSPRTESYLSEQYGFSSNDILYIPNGVYIGERGTGSTAIKGDETLDALSAVKKGGSFLVLFSGSLIASNRLSTIIEAAELLQAKEQIKIVLIGKGQEEINYRTMIREKGLVNISILPPVQKNRVPLLLNCADALILNQGNVQWGSSNKLYDYMASSRPIISSVYAKHNDVVAEVNGGISVEPENALALKEAIETLFNMSQHQRESMSIRNRDYVEKHHDWRILAKKLETIFDENH
jgi:glycosyltransferase involved in cell wall biosynthesis